MSHPPTSPANTQISPPRSSRHSTRLKQFLQTVVRDDLLIECQLLLLSFSIGIQDAASFPDYHCFASNQTGNTVLLAAGAAKLTALFSLSNIGTSLSMFVLGAFLLGQLGNHLGPRKRWWLILTSVFQTALVFAAAALQYSGPNPVEATGPTALAVLSLLAFSSGAQVAMARGLQITEITTAMATAAYVDVLIDEKLFVKRNRKRNRRIAFLFSLFIGSFAGAFAYKARGSAFALVVSGVGKAVVSISLVVNKGIVECREKSETRGEILV
ncbi:hypothetical protein BCIN_12g05930 [Botrytis cinerea B05.10]|uniref:DUF1275 domain protein n=1 Tax=Botryotinia fuckeliana (strain B05.10) TaxID=332648 RepID=A0A384JZM9_BOTFB|nr:hypothetical protein BCIN_12g05930 [Botrytis cinerea B05.10]ATZ56056.1 hypothetical protein BCIN_12g05930 [Botrytis cinerea B05.10]